MGSIGMIIGRSSEIATAIAAAVEEQGVATHEIARNVAEAARATGVVSDRVVRLSEGAAQVQGQLRELNAASVQVAQQGEALRNELGGVVRQLRSGS